MYKILSSAIVFIQQRNIIDWMKVI